jgi:hypothetical protein
MAQKKDAVLDEPKNLWMQELVTPVTMRQFSTNVAETEKIILFGESNTGKTSFYIGILGVLKKQGIKPEDLLMCIIFPDRPTGITKLMKVIPPEYLDNIFVFPVNSYEELVSSTAQAEKKLQEHYKKTGKYGWLVIELLEDAWKSAQDYYCRLAYGETLGEYFAKKKADVKAMKDDNTAYKALEGWGDWPIIKYFHNFNWIDKIKRMQYNVVFSAELKEEGNKDSNFFDLGYRPGGEKDNMHRVDTIIYLSHKGNNFGIKPYKLTGYDKLYGELDVTNKNAYSVHVEALRRLEQLGYRTSKMRELEKEANIVPPKPKEEKTITTISKTSNGEKEEKITKEELVKKEDKGEEKWSI